MHDIIPLQYIVGILIQGTYYYTANAFNILNVISREKLQGKEIFKERRLAKNH